MKKIHSVLLIVAILLSIVAFSWAQERKPENSEYTIGVGDVLEIVTWKEPDFSRDTVLVRLDGKITFPLINDLKAAGLTTTQLKSDIENRIKEYVADPNVTVTLRDAVSQKYYILGEVTRTGEYPLVKDLTVLQAFALAGGFTQWASKKEIILFRRVEGKEKVIQINYVDIVKAKDFSQNVFIQADDTIIVP